MHVLIKSDQYVYALRTGTVMYAFLILLLPLILRAQDTSITGGSVGQISDGQVQVPVTSPQQVEASSLPSELVPSNFIKSWLSAIEIELITEATMPSQSRSMTLSTSYSKPFSSSSAKRTKYTDSCVLRQVDNFKMELKTN